MAVYASAAIWNNLREILDRHERSGIAVQWNGGLEMNFDFWNVHGITLTFQETRSIHDSMNIQKSNVLLIFTFYYKS